MPTVLLIGTLDTKGDEYAYLAERLKLGGVDVLVADTGTGGPPHGLEPDIGAAEVAREAGADVAPHGATLEDGYRAAEVCDAMLRSAEQGARETVSYR